MSPAPEPPEPRRDLKKPCNEFLGERENQRSWLILVRPRWASFAEFR